MNQWFQRTGKFHPFEKRSRKGLFKHSSASSIHHKWVQREHEVANEVNSGKYLEYWLILRLTKSGNNLLCSTIRLGIYIKR